MKNMKFLGYCAFLICFQFMVFNEFAQANQKTSRDYVESKREIDQKIPQMSDLEISQRKFKIQQELESFKKTKIIETNSKKLLQYEMEKLEKKCKSCLPTDPSIIAPTKAPPKKDTSNSSPSAEALKNSLDPKLESKPLGDVVFPEPKKEVAKPSPPAPPAPPTPTPAPPSEAAEETSEDSKLPVEDMDAPLAETPLDSIFNESAVCLPLDTSFNDVDTFAKTVQDIQDQEDPCFKILANDFPKVEECIRNSSNNNPNTEEFHEAAIKCAQLVYPDNSQAQGTAIAKILRNITNITPQDQMKISKKTMELTNAGFIFDTEKNTVNLEQLKNTFIPKLKENRELQNTLNEVMNNGKPGFAENLMALYNTDDATLRPTSMQLGDRVLYRKFKDGKFSVADMSIDEYKSLAESKTELLQKEIVDYMKESHRLTQTGGAYLEAAKAIYKNFWRSNDLDPLLTDNQNKLQKKSDEIRAELNSLEFNYGLDTKKMNSTYMLFMQALSQNNADLNASISKINQVGTAIILAPTAWFAAPSGLLFAKAAGLASNLAIGAATGAALTTAVHAGVSAYTGENFWCGISESLVQGLIFTPAATGILAKPFAYAGKYLKGVYSSFTKGGKVIAEEGIEDIAEKGIEDVAQIALQPKPNLALPAPRPPQQTILESGETMIPQPTGVMVRPQPGTPTVATPAPTAPRPSSLKPAEAPTSGGRPNPQKTTVPKSSTAKTKPEKGTRPNTAPPKPAQEPIAKTKPGSKDPEASASTGGAKTPPKYKSFSDYAKDKYRPSDVGEINSSLSSENRLAQARKILKIDENVELTVDLVSKKANALTKNWHEGTFRQYFDPKESPEILKAFENELRIINQAKSTLFEKIRPQEAVK